MISLDIKTKQRGFGVIEVLVASTTIAIILSALVVAGNNALKGSVRLGQRSQATFLAQEGIEIVRQIRDTNWIDADNATKWNSLIWDGNDLIELTLNETYDNCILEFKDEIDRYGLTCNNDPDLINQNILNLNNTEFKRVISIENVGDLIPSDGINAENNLNQSYNSLKITATVSWNSGETSIDVSEILTNWRPQY